MTPIDHGGPIVMRVLDAAVCIEHLVQLGLARLLEAAVTDPARAISRLDILAPDERDTILHDWNDACATRILQNIGKAVPTKLAWSSPTGPRLWRKVIHTILLRIRIK